MILPLMGDMLSGRQPRIQEVKGVNHFLVQNIGSLKLNTELSTRGFPKSTEV
jgi:hypothetical protein